MLIRAPYNYFMEFNDDSYEIIGAAMEVHSELGPGLREKPYENALVIALQNKGFQVKAQKAYPIYFLSHIVGDCIPDITVNSNFLVEVKSVDKLSENEVAQLLNYLRISKIEVGLIINFKNHKLEWKRVVKQRSV